MLWTLLAGSEGRSWELQTLTVACSPDALELVTSGKTATLLPWSTPVGAYRRYGDIRLASTGEGRWHDPRGEYAYIQLAIDSVEYNVPPQ